MHDLRRLCFDRRLQFITWNAKGREAEGFLTPPALELENGTRILSSAVPLLPNKRLQLTARHPGACCIGRPSATRPVLSRDSFSRASRRAASGRYSVHHGRAAAEPQAVGQQSEHPLQEPEKIDPRHLRHGRRRPRGAPFSRRRFLALHGRSGGRVLIQRPAKRRFCSLMVVRQASAAGPRGVASARVDSLGCSPTRH